ncbi:MAG: alpha/beta hydrolase [Deltaproteobacteria bacterium]|nr:alpha/beta hydrolase [Deltaproteobacteria bacterium]
MKWKESLIKKIFAGSTIINTKGGPVEYTVDGNSGPYVMVMHGAPGGYDQTAALFGDMLGKGFRVLSWSRPGYLRTPLEDGATFEKQADLAAALIDSLGIDRIAVLGYSAGGPSAIYFNVAYPDKVWALILECAVTRRWRISPGNIEEKIYFGHLVYDDAFLWAADAAAHITPRLIGMSTIEMESSLERDEQKKLIDDIMEDKQRVEVLKNMIKSMSPAELRRDGIKNDIAQLHRIKDLPMKNVTAPTLIIHGSDDADVSVADAQLAATKIPESELYLVPGGFHVMALTDSIDQITGERVSFLQKHSPR